MRSLNTSFVAVLPVASLLVRRGVDLFGALALRDFALALFVGLLTGAYSSIFVATPILAWLKEREPRYRALRERSEEQLARAEARVEAPAEEPDASRSPNRSPNRSRPAAQRAGGARHDRARPRRDLPADHRRRTPPSTRAPRPRQQRRRKRR